MDWVILYIVCVMISAFLTAVSIHLEGLTGDEVEEYIGTIILAVLFPPLGIGLSILSLVSHTLETSKAKRSK
jgi:uncharacterized Tic20 family protein